MKIFRIAKNIAIVVFFLAVFAFASYSDSTRPLAATVSNIDRNVITFTDGCGDDWEWEAGKKEKYEIGDEVTLILNMNGTPHTWWDDKIVHIRKSK